MHAWDYLSSSWLVSIWKQLRNQGFPGGSEVKVSASNVGDPGSIPGSGRSPGERNGKIPWTEEPGGLQSMGTGLSDFTKEPTDGFPGGSDSKESACNAGELCLIPGWEDLLEKGLATYYSIFAWRIPWTKEPSGLHPWGSREADTTERLSLSLFFFPPKKPTEPLKAKQAFWNSFLSLMADFGYQFCYKTDYLSSSKLLIWRND